MTQYKENKPTAGSLSRRASRVQTTIIAVVVLAFCLAIMLFNIYRLNTRIEERIESTATLAETSLATAVWQVDHDSARDFIKALARDPDVVFAQVITGRETMAFEINPKYSGKSFDFFSQSKRFKTKTVEIRKFGDWIGTFRMAFSMQSVHRDMIINAAGTMALGIVLIFVISQTTLYFSRKRLFDPLKRLEEAATAIAEGDLDANIDTHLQGELGSLARAIDDMRDSVRHLIDDLHVSNNRLEDHRSALEKTINERTNELEHKNESLNKALEDIRNAKQAAEVANIAKSSFLASMSHEIRTPMNAILGMADILQETSLSEDQTRYVQVFRSAGEDLLMILDDVLDLAKIETGRLSLDNVSFSLSETVDTTCAIIEHKAKEKGLDFSHHVASKGLDQFKGDPARLRQVMLNLLSNAVKFTDTGFIRLTVDVGRDGGTAPIVQFSVTDSGPGIPVDKLDSIFEAFTQVDASTTRRFGGTGLGLAICRELVRMMDGQFWVESAHGTGSTFHFSIRLEVDDNQTAPGKQEAPKPKDPCPKPPPANLLMIEDSRYNAFVIQTYLKNTPCELTLVENGEDGIREFRQGNFDAVLMDIQMPVMDGYEATRAIRQWETENNLTRTPIIAMTAYVQPEDAEECIKAGADRHLAKPVKKSALFCMLKTVIEGKIAVSGDDAMRDLRHSLTAADAALGRRDFGSLRALGGDIAERGRKLSLSKVPELAAGLAEAARREDQDEVMAMLDRLFDMVDPEADPA